MNPESVLLGLFLFVGSIIFLSTIAEAAARQKVKIEVRKLDASRKTAREEYLVLSYAQRREKETAIKQNRIRAAIAKERGELKR